MRGNGYGAVNHQTGPSAAAFCVSRQRLLYAGVAAAPVPRLIDAVTGFDPQRDRMVFDGTAILPGVFAQDAGAAMTKLRLDATAGQAALRRMLANVSGQRLVAKG